MGFFSDLTNLSLGGQLGKSLTGRSKSTGSLALDLAKGPAKPKQPEPFNPANRIGATIGGKSGVDQPSQRLGWTNGGYTYNNSPWNKEPAGAGMQMPTMGKMTPGPAMGFGGQGSGMISSPKTPPPGMGSPPPSYGAPPMGGGIPMGTSQIPYQPSPPPQMPQPIGPSGPQTQGQPQMDPRIMQQMIARQLRQPRMM